MKKETKLSIALHIVAMIILAAFMWALADYKAALISLLVYVACAAIREMGKQEGQREMDEKCLENFIEGAAKVVKDTDLAMKALGIDEETQEKIRKAREIVHKAHCADLPVPDKIVIRKETEPQPPSFEESQGETGTNVADWPMPKEQEQQTMEEYLLSQLDTPVVLNWRSSESRAKPRLSYAESRRKWAKAKDGTMMTFERFPLIGKAA